MEEVSAARRARYALLTYITWCVFAMLDTIDQLLCPLFALLDRFFDYEPAVCYCGLDIQRGHPASRFSTSEVLKRTGIGDQRPRESWTGSSDTLYAPVRKSATTGLHLFTHHRCLISNNHTTQNSAIDDSEKNWSKSKTPLPVVEGEQLPNRVRGQPISPSHLRNLTEESVEPLSRTVIKQGVRWSDCGCQRCTSWQTDENQLLYVFVDDKDVVGSGGDGINFNIADKNVIFLHGFLSSSSFWVDTVLPALPESVRSSHRLFALDILGFGRSPKPSNCLYTIADHVDMIRRSVLEPHGIRSFHLVAHSMGCTIALAVAAHYSSTLKSITLIAPPYFPVIPGSFSGTYLMQQLAPRKIWPLITFGSSVMSWYEHIGRVVCLVVCKNHRFWEPLLFFVHSKLPGKRIPLSRISDFTRHTHHSAWHNFHNTICRGGYAADHCLQVLLEAGRRVRVIHGTRDSVIPFNGSVNLSHCYPNVQLTAVASADHGTVIFGREEMLADELAKEILSSSCLQC